MRQVMTVDEWLDSLLAKYKEQEGEANMYAATHGHISAILKVAVIMGDGLDLPDVNDTGIMLVHSSDLRLDNPVLCKLVAVADGPDERVEVDE